MRINQTGSDISDKAVRRIVKFVTDEGINGSEGYRDLSAKETAAGVANFLRHSSDKFLKEEEFMTEVLDKLDKKEAKLWEVHAYPKPLSNFLGHIIKKQYSRILQSTNFEKVSEGHVSILENALDIFFLGPKKKYPTTVKTINDKFLNNPKLSLAEGTRRYDKYYNYYMDKVFKMVKEKLEY